MKSWELILCSVFLIIACLSQSGVHSQRTKFRYVRPSSSASTKVRTWKVAPVTLMKSHGKRRLSNSIESFQKDRPVSLEGWLEAPKSSVVKTIDVASEDKPGYCGSDSSYGIRCGIKLDQCSKDRDCPGVTKCCSVSDCGSLCVKPKDKKLRKIERSKKTALKSSKTAENEDSIAEESNIESQTTAEGLKMEDITVLDPKADE